MRLTNPFEHLSVAKVRHHIHRGSPIVIVESPRECRNAPSRASDVRWRAASYEDPWPDRA